MGVLWISRDGERIFPTPPRPVEKIYNNQAAPVISDKLYKEYLPDSSAHC